jgi:hypothetical protein
MHFVVDDDEQKQTNPEMVESAINPKPYFLMAVND